MDIWWLITKWLTHGGYWPINTLRLHAWCRCIRGYECSSGARAPCRWFLATFIVHSLEMSRMKVSESIIIYNSINIHSWSLTVPCDVGKIMRAAAARRLGLNLLVSVQGIGTHVPINVNLRSPWQEESRQEVWATFGFGWCHRPFASGKSSGREDYMCGYVCCFSSYNYRYEIKPL